MKNQDSGSRRIFKLSDIVIAAVILLVAVIMLINSGEEGSYAAVYYNGEQVGSYTLFADGFYPLEEYGITLEVKDNKICVFDSDCPDKVCVKTGYISSPKQTIVCLPNRISVRIINENNDDNIDIVLN